jgi:hypothetical protein
MTDCARNVISPEGHVHLATRLEIVAELEEDDPSIRTRNAEFDPALFVTEGLIGQQPNPDNS